MTYIGTAKHASEIRARISVINDRYRDARDD
jgi:hypothetical protein